MASKDIYTIPSSPSKTSQTYSMSSPLPSPSQAFKKKPTVLRAGSRAPPIPQDATASFTSAPSLLRMNKEGSMDTIGAFALGADTLQELKQKTAKSKPRETAVKEGEEGEVAKKPQRTAPKKDKVEGAEAKPRKARTKKAEAVEENGAVKEKAPRKSRAKKKEGESDATKEKALRKPRAKKSNLDVQTQLPQAQVTKPLYSEGDPKTTEKKRKPASEDDPFADSLDYGLDVAIKRRAGWTPPPPTGQLNSLTSPVFTGLLSAGLRSGSKDPVERSSGFQDLLGSFGFSKIESSVAANIVPDGAGVKKRKLIELVATNPSTTASKAKAPRKKARTVTEAATSAYLEVSEDVSNPTSLLQYLSSETMHPVRKDGFKVPSKPRSKSPVKGETGTAQAPILLSPESALKQVVSQDFIFGTSSQLAREQSPTFLRDIHAAMQASNEADLDDPFASPPSQFGTRGKSMPMTNRNLWSVAARDGSGKLLDVEMVNLADTPAVARHPSERTELTAHPPSKQKVFETWDDIEDLLEDSSTIKEAAEPSPKQVGPVEAAIRFELLSSPASSVRSPAKVSPSKASNPAAAKSLKAKRAKSTEMPDFEGYTVTQLTKAVASYHFKPVKNRDQMIVLLQKCWESKQRLAMGNLSTNLPIKSPIKAAKSLDNHPPSSQVPLNSQKRGRGRPREDDSAPSTPKRKSMKTKTASLANALIRAQKKAEAADEISDSDTAIRASLPRRQPSQIGTPPLPLQLSSSASVDDRELSPASSQALLFNHISTAVKNASPSADSSNPSWHEKILLYDPIVLEDLTVWLNTGALEKAGWDDEVDPKEVKKWCESKSICCLWKENLSGAARNRY